MSARGYATKFSLLPRGAIFRAGADGVDTIGISSGPVQPGRGLTGNGTAYITITGLLTTDTIVADSTDQPTCTVNGRLDIANGVKVWGVTITRNEEQIGRYLFSEGTGTILVNSVSGSGALPVGILSDSGIRANYFDGTGFDVNIAGFTVSDGASDYADEYLQYLIANGAIIPPGASWRIL